MVGLIGWPVEHSVSPAMHNAAFEALGLDWCYVPLPVRPGHIAEALAGIVALGFGGVNVTVPHKQALVPLVDELSEAARAIGAVNTVIVMDGGRTTGHNTDAGGFMRALKALPFDPHGCSALVLGAGGAARAVVYALATNQVEVTVLNRTPERAEALVEALRGFASARLYAGPLIADRLRKVGANVDLVVNTTPLGMWPHIEGSPWPEELPFPAHALLFDLVYNPRETRLMCQARAVGARACNGLDMLVYQGAEAFTSWTGREAPVDVMRDACLAALQGAA